jgi:hypothetical protein
MRDFLPFGDRMSPHFGAYNGVDAMFGAECRGRKGMHFSETQRGDEPCSGKTHSTHEAWKHEAKQPVLPVFQQPQPLPSEGSLAFEQSRANLA